MHKNRSRPSKSVVVGTKEEMPEGPPLEVTGEANGSQALTVTWKVGGGNSKRQ